MRQTIGMMRKIYDMFPWNVITLPRLVPLHSQDCSSHGDGFISQSLLKPSSKMKTFARGDKCTRLLCMIPWRWYGPVPRLIRFTIPRLDTVHNSRWQNQSPTTATLPGSTPPKSERNGSGERLKSAREHPKWSEARWKTRLLFNWISQTN